MFPHQTRPASLFLSRWPVTETSSWWHSSPSWWGVTLSQWHVGGDQDAAVLSHVTCMTSAESKLMTSQKLPLSGRRLASRVGIYSQTCSKYHLYINTTCLSRPHVTSPQVYTFHAIEPAYIDHLWTRTRVPRVVPKVVFIYKFHCTWYTHDIYTLAEGVTSKVKLLYTKDYVRNYRAVIDFWY